MTDKEIVQALRTCVMDPDDGGDCENCPASRSEGEYCLTAVMSEAADLIERLTAENVALREKQRWIPVTERMPELEVPVLVLDQRGNMIVRTLRRLVSDKEAVFRPDGLAPRKNITHWMALPEAPEKGGCRWLHRGLI